MAIITSRGLQSSYDVVIVGSGAGAAKWPTRFTMAGSKVLVLEAGRDFDP